MPDREMIAGYRFYCFLWSRGYKARPKVLEPIRKEVESMESVVIL